MGFEIKVNYRGKSDMVDFNLDMDESIVLESTYVQKIGQKKEYLKEMILTNKNLIYVFLRRNGIIGKPIIEVVKVSLDEIKIYDGKVQAEQVRNSHYGTCLQVQFMSGREFFVFQNSSRKTISQWVNELNRILIGNDSTKIQIKYKSNPFEGLSDLASNLKTVADSAIQTVSSTAKQVAASAIEKNTSTSENVKECYELEKQMDGTSSASHTMTGSFCVNCGSKIIQGAKFCQSCGTQIESNVVPPIQQAPPIHDYSNGAQRQQEFAGKVLKCPNCGGIISQTTAICPECGMRITGQAAVSSVENFNKQLMYIENSRKKAGFRTIFNSNAVDHVDQKKLSLIRSFPIPNTVDDILEFMMLAVVNIDVGLSKKTMIDKLLGDQKQSESSLTISKTISDAWISKMQQTYQKAELSFPNDPAFLNIKQIYIDKMKELKIKID